jgi:hypothetical protein
VDGIGFLSGLHFKNRTFSISATEEAVLYEAVNAIVMGISPVDWSTVYKKSVRWVVSINIMLPIPRIHSYVD